MSPMPRPWPTEEDALAMPVDELALHVLWRLTFTQQRSTPLTSPVNFLAATPPTSSARSLSLGGIGAGGQVLGRSVDLKGPYSRAVFEAWQWLTATGLLARDHEQSGPWYFVTRRGEEVARDPEGLARLAAERRIGVALHERLERRIRRQFLIGEYELAAFAAMREVEIRVRELAGAGNAPGDLGVKLVQREFGEGGVLSDAGAEAASVKRPWRCSGARWECSRIPAAIERSRSTTRRRHRRSSCSPIFYCEYSTALRFDRRPRRAEVPLDRGVASGTLDHMSVVMVSEKRQPDGDIGFEARRALGFIDSVIPPGERPGPVSIDVPECRADDARRIVSTWLDLGLPGWGERLELSV